MSLERWFSLVCNSYSDISSEWQLVAFCTCMYRMNSCSANGFFFSCKFLIQVYSFKNN